VSSLEDYGASLILHLLRREGVKNKGRKQDRLEKRDNGGHQTRESAVAVGLLGCGCLLVLGACNTVARSCQTERGVRLLLFHRNRRPQRPEAKRLVDELLDKSHQQDRGGRRTSYTPPILHLIASLSLPMAQTQFRPDAWRIPSVLLFIRFFQEET